MFGRIKALKQQLEVVKIDRDCWKLQALGPAPMTIGPPFTREEFYGLRADVTRLGERVTEIEEKPTSKFDDRDLRAQIAGISERVSTRESEEAQLAAALGVEIGDLKAQVAEINVWVTLLAKESDQAIALLRQDLGSSNKGILEQVGVQQAQIVEIDKRLKSWAALPLDAGHADLHNSIEKRIEKLERAERKRKKGRKR